MDDDKLKVLAKKTWMDSLKGAFAPASVRADEDIAEQHAQHPDQLESDMQLSPQEKMKKIQKGFLGY